MGVLTGLGYCATAATMIELTSNGRNHATVWPADALILALLLKYPRMVWPTILLCGWIGNLAANAMLRGPSFGIVFYGAINMGQALLAALLLTRHFTPKRDFLGDTLASGQFLLYAGLIAPGLGAVAGSIVSHLTFGQPIGASILRWYASNAIGLLIGTPVLLALFDGSYHRCFAGKTRWERAEAMALLGFHTALTFVVFGQTRYPLLFLPLSSLLLVAFRLGRLGTFAGVAMVAIAGAVAAYLGLGPMALIHDGPVFQSLYVQIYIAVISCTALPGAATVSSRSKALAELAEHRQALQQILSHAPEGILSLDETGLCRWADGRLEEFTGLGPSAFVGLTIEEIAEQISPALLRLVQDANASVDDDESRAMTCDFSADLTPDRTLEASIGIVQQGGRRTGMVLTLRDISARKSRERAISLMAETDDLTGLLNRKGFRQRLATAVESGTAPVTLALVDVDHFKVINDTHGHTVGDRVLEILARRLSAATRSVDAIGRLGGDEFAILFDCDVRTASAACERIAASVRHDPELAKLGLSASISCGVAQMHPGMARGELFDAADMALYAVKRAGRDGVRTAA